MRAFLKRIPVVLAVYSWLIRRRDIWLNRHLHNRNNLFYTLSPEALPALVKAFQIAPSSGNYYEFGVFKGFSLWFASRITEGRDMKLFGFDSFQGLPAGKADKSPWWKEGNYSASHKFVKQHMTDSRVVLVPGFYSRALFESFEEHHGVADIAVIMIDCDIYESAKEILGYFGPRLRAGAIVLFDDIRNTGPHGEGRALAESGLKLNHLFDYGTFGSVYRFVGI